MLYEMREYKVQVHKVDDFLQVYNDVGIHIIKKYATLVGCWYTEIGTLNTIVYMWSYDDFNHRIEQRKKLWSDKDWLEFVPSIRQYMLEQKSRILLPAPFSPLN